ncbi:MAG TPA: hypothetical protein VIU82_02025 [Bosea sp. (in: a-proteobacteria)]
MASLTNARLFSIRQAVCSAACMDLASTKNRLFRADRDRAGGAF